MYNCVIFDVDGTLIDTEKAVITSLQKAFYEKTGKEYTYEELIFVYGVPLSNVLPTFNFQNPEEVSRRYLQILKESFLHVKCFPGVEGVLKRLKNAGITTGIATSRTKEEVHGDPCLGSIIGYFDYVVSADDTVRHKPDAEPLLKLLEWSGGDPSTTLYIGDTVYDSMCARSAGIHFALASWGVRNTKGIYYNYLLKDLKEVLDLV